MNWKQIQMENIFNIFNKISELQITEYIFSYRPLLLPSLSSPSHKQLLLVAFSKTPEKQLLEQIEKKKVQN